MGLVRFSAIFKYALACAVLLLGAQPPASAAELRIDFRELATLAGTILNDAKLRLHNVPGGVLDFTAGSSVTIGGVDRPIPIPVRSFEAAGARYAYLMNDINSQSIKVSAVNGAVRLSIAFEDDGPELVGRCLSGICPPDGALPNIEWQKPSVAIDLVPVKIGDSLSLKAKRMEIMGTLDPRCLPSAGFFAGSLCRAVLPQVKRTISKLRSDLDKGLVEQVNASAIQEKIAQSLKAFLAVGPAGEVHISKIAVDSEGKAVVVSFCLAC